MGDGGQNFDRENVASVGRWCGVVDGDNSATSGCDGVLPLCPAGCEIGAVAHST